MRKLFLTGMLLSCMMLSQVYASVQYSQLKPGQEIYQFRAEAVYHNAADQAIGARFRHIPSGFVLDLISIQSLPQAFVWVNSVPPTDKGEPHTCEHLLLGKGTVGRYVASLQDMSLSQSSAFTMQLQTCYHYNTSAGADVFFSLFKEQMNAFLHPNYSDEEIRREVCNMGIREEESDGSLQLEEKGTVYNEMVSSFESPYGNVYFEIDRLVYGTDHPLSRSSGGHPDAIRQATPADLRAFQESSYHLNNMGAIVSLPSEISLDQSLKAFTDIFAEVEPNATVSEDPVTLNDRLPQANAAPIGSIKLNSYPSPKDNDPGPVVFAWPATRQFDPKEQYLAELLMANLSSDQTSILYQAMIDSKTRKIDCGATGLNGWVSSDLGYPLYLAIENVKREWLNEEMLDSLRRVVLNEIKAIAAYSDGSKELTEFNERVKARMHERKRQLRVGLNMPPRFGYRGTGSDWLYRMQRSARHGGFERSLVYDQEFEWVDNVLATDKNIWREYIQKWQLEQLPYVSAGLSDPNLLANSEKARVERISAFVGDLKKQYGVSEDALAIAEFKKEYDAQTEIIDNEAKSIPLPPFIENPPFTLDDQLRYTVDKLPGGGDLVISTFENMTGATSGIAFRLDALPESLVFYIPALPTLMTNVGIVKDGQPISYTEVREAQRREILGINAYFSTNYRTERAELVVRGSGSEDTESIKAVEWMNTVLFDQDLRPENLARIKDAIDQAWAGARNRTRGSVENWVDSPVNAYWRQHNPLLLSADCFLTQAHALYRIRWMLKDGATPATTKEFADFARELAVRGQGLNRDALSTLLTEVGDAAAATEPVMSGSDLAMRVSAFAEDSKAAVKEAATDLKLLMSDLADASLAADWTYLCNQMATDYETPAGKVLTDVKTTLSYLLKRDNVRGFMIASSATQNVVKPRLAEIVSKLDASKTARASYAKEPVVFKRLQQRYPEATRPLYAGLVFENTRAGVLYNTAECASFLDTSNDALLNFLAGRLYGGGGAHSMFMKTWGAGLAYSNGLRTNEMSGRIVYYAERCPDVAQTMQFVVNELKQAPPDPSLADYAVAQAFLANRGGNNYEARGEAMAADLVDGVTPEAVTAFRKRILSLKDGDMFAQQLHSRMETVYGLLLPGYGPSAQESVEKADARYFIVGPESQFESWEKYLKATEGDLPVYRLYPRDFWLTGNGSKSF